MPPSLRTPDESVRLSAILRSFARAVLAAVAIYMVAGFVSLRLSWTPDVRPGHIVADGDRHDPSVAFALADEASRLVTATPRRALVGALSVHSARSHDAEGSLAEVAGAARRTALDFVVLGDHPGDWMFDEGTDPHWNDGVLVVGGLELVVKDVGRVLVTGLDTLPRRWESDLGSLLDRLSDEGGFASVIHPRSPRARERWVVPDARPAHAWEAMDVSEMARRRLADPWMAYHVTSLVGGLLTGRGHESLLRLGREGFDGWGLAAYDSVRAAGPLTVTGGLNHHPKRRLFGSPFPRYEPFFRSVANHVLVSETGSEDARDEWAGISAGLRLGRSFVSLGDAAGARGFRFGAETADGWIEMGSVADWTPDATLRIHLPEGGRKPLLVRVVGNGRERAWLEAPAGAAVAWNVPAPGVYRVEVHRAGRRFGPLRWNRRPWLLSNPVELVHPTVALR